jgi:hypothetical protein
VEAGVGTRHFRVTIYERLTENGPRFSTNYEEKIQVEIDHEWRQLWVKADLPWETSDSAEECLRAALAQVDKA